MPYVKSGESYEVFTQGRTVEHAVHREDSSPGECCGWVEDVQGTDTSIDTATYESLVLDIQAYNAELSVPVQQSAQEEYAALTEMDDRVAFLAKRIGLA